MKPRLFRRAVAAVAIAALLAPAAPFYPNQAYAAASVPKLDTIRVALSLEAGNLRSAEPAATLSSPKGLDLALRTASAAHPWPADLPLAPKVKGMADQYRVKLLETAEYAKAKALADAIKTSNANIVILANRRSAQTFYQVAAAGYPTKEGASSALTALSQLPAVSALSEKPVLTGPLHLSAGTFDSAADAEKQRTLLSQAGIDSSIALLEKQGGGLQYGVWIGAEADNESLQSFRLKVLKLMPALQPVPVESAKPYALLTEDATDSANGAASASLLLIPALGMKLWISAKEGTVAVAEKSNRAYRGAVEISVHNGKLAVINELPFEQYLYSVVTGEMGKGWPLEALKAQAVAARTYALKAGVKYQIAHVSDTTSDQVYTGIEDADSVRAVDATKGEVLVNQEGLITAFFSSNAGGMTSTGVEAYGNPIPYLKPVQSPDEGAAKNKAVWFRSVLPDGRIGYVHSSYVKESGEKNPAGMPVYTILEQGVNVRAAPYVDNVNNPAIAKLNTGDRVTVFGQVQESNAYSWFRGPYSQSELLKELNQGLENAKLNRIAGPLQSLEVKQRGPSGRVTELAANGASIKLKSPDSYRALLGGLPSTRFEIERSGGYTIQGASGTSAISSGSTLYALSAGGQAQAVQGSHYFVLDGGGKVNFALKDTQFTITGTGYGHGLGLSQWGARGLAETGYDYKKILSYYYEGVTLTKE